MIWFNHREQRYELVQSCSHTCSFCGRKLTPKTDYKLSLAVCEPTVTTVNDASWTDEHGVAHTNETYYKIKPKQRTVKTQHFCPECWENQCRKHKW